MVSLDTLNCSANFMMSFARFLRSGVNALLQEPGGRGSIVLRICLICFSVSLPCDMQAS